jgi:hypothetical protein
MKTRLFLRIAAIVSLLLAIGHSIGGTKSWSPMPDNDVFRAMRTVRFDVGSASRTYLDFYLGVGWSRGVLLLLQAAALWQIASLFERNPGPVRRLTMTFLVANVAVALISWKLILPPPVILCSAVAAALAVAWVAAGRESQPA